MLQLTNSVRVVKTHNGGMVQAFHVDVQQGWSLFIGEWLTRNVLWGMASPHPSSSTADEFAEASD